MEMKKYLIDTFKFNDSANRKLLPKILELSEKDECIKLFSHLINCQYKWMAGIKNAPNASELEWWNPVYQFDQLESEWQKSLELWIEYLAGMTDENLAGEIVISNFDGASWKVKPQDIALQLNYHSIHHRAQIQYLIRKQGFKPDFLDYIRGRFRKI